MIGNYTYLDGDMHVKLSLCADVLIQALRQVRTIWPLSSSYLGPIYSLSSPYLIQALRQVRTIWPLSRP